MDELTFIKNCVENNRILWTYHVNMRLRERFISRQSIIHSTESFEIIERYNEDHPLSSCLVYSEYNGEIFHIVFALDFEYNQVRIVTAYKPNIEEWEPDFKTRRKSK